MVEFPPLWKQEGRIAMPKEIKLSDKVSGIIGFPDGHVEVAVKLPWPLGSTSLRIEAGELDDAQTFINAGIAHREKVFGPPKKK